MERTPRSPRLKIEVTEEIINAAVPRDSSHCMIAEAVSATFPDARRVSVDLQTIRFSDPRRGLRYTYLTPRIAQLALIQFDQGTLSEPFAFQLRGAQVTAMARPRGSGLTEKELDQRKAASATRRENLKRTRLVQRESEAAGAVPDRVGGKPPPTTSLARRRSFGLRSLNV